MPTLPQLTLLRVHPQLLISNAGQHTLLPKFQSLRVAQQQPTSAVLLKQTKPLMFLVNKTAIAKDITMVAVLRGILRTTQSKAQHPDHVSIQLMFP